MYVYKMGRGIPAIWLVNSHALLFTGCTQYQHDNPIARNDINDTVYMLLFTSSVRYTGERNGCSQGGIVTAKSFSDELLNDTDAASTKEFI